LIDIQEMICTLNYCWYYGMFQMNFKLSASGDIIF